MASILRAGAYPNQGNLLTAERYGRRAVVGVHRITAMDAAD
jgi:hypothetical protein